LFSYCQPLEEEGCVFFLRQPSSWHSDPHIFAPLAFLYFQINATALDLSEVVKTASTTKRMSSCINKLYLYRPKASQVNEGAYFDGLLHFEF
jgi:hypothetical protein